MVANILANKNYLQMHDCVTVENKTETIKPGHNKELFLIQRRILPPPPTLPQGTLRKKHIPLFRVAVQQVSANVVMLSEYPVPVPANLSRLSCTETL